MFGEWALWRYSSSRLSQSTRHVLTPERTDWGGIMEAAQEIGEVGRVIPMSLKGMNEFLGEMRLRFASDGLRTLHKADKCLHSTNMTSDLYHSGCMSAFQDGIPRKLSIQSSSN
jgi:hypothetical protein